ncbi:MAG: 4-hydroxy-tetrahydrodipicolinate reductase [Candidatus Eisenbacteria bacterium]
MIRVVLMGAAGRMGRAVEAAAAGSGDITIGARVDLRGNIPGDGSGWSDDLAAVLKPGDVVVDFSGPAGARLAAQACAAAQAGLVTGSTGLAADDEAALQSAVVHVPVLRASNFSLGVAALRVALRAALAAVPGSWDVEIVERHHRLKKDSPSGTAVTLANDVRAARSLPLSAVRHGREGLVGPRASGELGMHAVRGGTWVGDHQVLLAGEGEWLELRHVAQDRAAFAHGALAAVRFVATAVPGGYTLEDVLGGPGPYRH